MFSKGITNLTLLTATEWVGVTFLLSMITISSRGQSFWDKVNKRLQRNGETVNTRRGIREKFKLPEKSKIAADEEEASGIICNAMDILYVLEMNLAFYAWYKRGEPFPVNDPISIAAVRKSITVLLKTIKDFTPRNHGNGWNCRNSMKFFMYLWIYICLEVHKTTITHQLNMD